MDEQLQIIQNPEQTYTTIRQSIVQAQHKLTAAINSAMVTAYWGIGEQIYKACGENDRAGYGKSCCNTCLSSSPPSSVRASTKAICAKCASFTVASQFETHCVPN